jgi:hypothetical protein
MHADSVDLRAFLDGELPEAERAAAARHVAECAQCRAELARLERTAGDVRQRLDTLAPRGFETSVPPRARLDRIIYRRRKEPVTMFKSLLVRRPLWAALAAVLAVAISFSFAPVRTWAGQFLGLFRVQQIQVLPVDTAALSNLQDDPTLTDQMTRLFADSVTMKREPGPSAAAASADEASQRAGFHVRLLQTGGTPQLTVEGGPAFEVRIDRDRAQAILNEAGRSDLQLPASIDGAVVSVDIPTGVSAAYGDCPRPEAQVDGSDPENWSQVRNCTLLAQVPSPTVDTPPDVNMRELAELGLQFTGMSPEEARAFSDTIDWTTTLVMPIPRNAAEIQQVTVDGVNGTVLYRPADDGVPQRYVLLWVKDGIVYTLSGYGSTDQAVAMANTIE